MCSLDGGGTIETCEHALLARMGAALNSAHLDGFTDRGRRAALGLAWKRIVEPYERYIYLRPTVTTDGGLIVTRAVHG